MCNLLLRTRNWPMNLLKQFEPLPTITSTIAKSMSHHGGLHAHAANTTTYGSDFATFSHAYASSEAPEYVDQFMSKLHTFIDAACRKYGASEQDALAFFRKIQAEVLSQEDITLKNVAVRLWQSCTKLQLAPESSIEFSALVNRMLRERDPELLPSGCSVVRSINVLFLKNDDPTMYTDKLHRGSTLPLQHLPFFTAGKMFRVPMYLSTMDEYGAKE